MAHFAKIVNNIVTDVIVAEQDFIDTQHHFLERIAKPTWTFNITLTKVLEFF